MNPWLDEIRARVGLPTSSGGEAPQPGSFRASPPDDAVSVLRQLLRAGSGPAELSRRTRRAVASVALACALVAVLHRPVRSLLGHYGGQPAVDAGAAVMSWPTPVVQPVLAGAAALALIVLAVVTQGYAQVAGPGQARGLLGAALGGTVVAAPMLFVCVAAVVAAVVMLMLFVVALVVALIAVIGILAGMAASG